MSSKVLVQLWMVCLIGATACVQAPNRTPKAAPNILFCIADDWSYPHAGAYGDIQVQTPHFDRIAEEGLLFHRAFTASPSCAPSRAAILTGQDMWRLGEGGLLFGCLYDTFEVYPDLLAEAGYFVGHTGKGYAPGNLTRGGWAQNPAGAAFQEYTLDPPDGIKATDYASNFRAFLEARPVESPFCFWFGAVEPHRRYSYGIGAAHGFAPDSIEVPAFLPDTDSIRNDIADYYYEIAWFDQHLGRMLQELESRALLENTLVIVTSDNGMPFPKAKSNLYDFGVQMPLAIRWGSQLQSLPDVTSPVSLIDIAPTLLEIAGVIVPKQMTGRSLAPLLLGAKWTPRPFAVTGLERHTIARPNNWGYPCRAIHTSNHTYIYNFEPSRWPAGAPDFDAWPQGAYGDIDGGATKTFMINHATELTDLFQAGFGKRPQAELFRSTADLANMVNLADDPASQPMRDSLHHLLFQYLARTGDPRIGGISPWDAYPFFGGQ